MAAIFVTVINPATFEILVYLAEGTKNVIEYIVSTISVTIDTFVTPSAIGRIEAPSLLWRPPIHV